MGHCHSHGHHDHCHSHDHGDCCSSHHHHHHDECCGCDHEGGFSDQFLALADEAWMEVLKEKIKENILKNDARIKELAAIISETNHERWSKIIGERRLKEMYKERLHDYFGGSCCTPKGKGKK